MFGFGKQTEIAEETVSAPAPLLGPPDNAAVAEALFGESYKGVIEIGPNGVRIVTAPLRAGGVSHNALAADHLGPVPAGAYRIGFNKSGKYLEIDSGLPWHKTITMRDIHAIRRALQEGGFLEGVDLNRTFLRIYADDDLGLYTLKGNRVGS